MTRQADMKLARHCHATADAVALVLNLLPEHPARQLLAIVEPLLREAADRLDARP